MDLQGGWDLGVCFAEGFLQEAREERKSENHSWGDFWGQRSLGN